MVDENAPGLVKRDGADEGEHSDSTPQPGSYTRFSLAPRNWRRLLKLRRMIRRTQRDQDVDADSPPLVLLDNDSAELMTHARMLASDGREDTNAVSELVQLADGNQRALQVAALGVRENGEHRESSWADRSHRLLQAAITNGSVAPITESERKRLALLDDFAGLSLSDQWRRLTELEPGLSGLTRSLPVEELAGYLTSTEVLDLPPQERGPIWAARQSARERLTSELAPLVGPQSSADNPILRSQIASGAALQYLVDVAERRPKDET
jgi:hypothetical protein